MNKIQSMLLGILIGDTFGAGYEFAFETLKEYKDNFSIEEYRQHSNKEYNHTAGMYTDDTQMSIAIAKLMLSNKEFNEKNLAQSFIETYQEFPIKGYAKRFQAFLESIMTGDEFIKKIKPNSIRNGAAMRAVPIGLEKDLEKVLQYATINAKLTHNTTNGIDSSIIIALLAHKELYNKKGNNFDFIMPYITHQEYFKKIKQMQELNQRLLFGNKWENKGVPCNGIRTAGAVLYLLSKNLSTIKTLKESIYLGGDTDSIASITLGITAINQNLDLLPIHLFNNLYNKEFGRDYILNLGKELSKKYQL